MWSSRSIFNAFFVLAVALALVPVAQASIYAMADGVNFNALARQKAQKRAQQNHYRDIVRNPFRLFKRQETDPGTPIPTPTDIGSISNTSTTTSAETTTTDASSSLTTLEPTSTDDETTTSTDAETTSSPTETETTTTDGITTTPSDNTELPSSTDIATTSEAQSTTTEDITSTPTKETSTTSSDEPSETSTDIPTSTEVTTSTEITTTVRTTLDTTVKSAFTTAWSTSTFTLPNGAVGTVTEFLVVVPTLSPTRAQNPQETETATGTASLHTNAGTLYTPGPAAPVVALMAVLGYVGGAAF
ncbi:hypothetical protein TWF481_005727 [Arthrobotrys musiformis]|uniref:Uncharacterized protein n=1 Tax=Arthrobotrys musiformis TaxID=47236 RepID=A0AAV9WEL3_9PEZI